MTTISHGGGSDSELRLHPTVLAKLVNLPRRPKVLSLGGGLDSWAMLLDGEKRGELPDIVAFVDDAEDRDEHPGEWDGTYRHVEEVVRPWCAARGIEFVEISARTGYLIRPENQGARSLFAWLWQMGQIPVAGPNRICTRIAKVERFEAWIDKRFPGQEVEVWIGFDAAESGRVENDPNAGKPRGPTYKRWPRGKTADERDLHEIMAPIAAAWRWTTALTWAMSHAHRVNRFPLMERGLCRCRCEALARASGYPVPRKSACMKCPYGSRGDWKVLAIERPRVFAKIVELEHRKGPTVKNGIKLSIMDFNSKTKTGTMLPQYIAKPYKPKVIPCPVCGAANRATKAAGCGYLSEGEVAA